MRDGQDEPVIEEPVYLCCQALMHSYVRMHLDHKPTKKCAVLLMETGVLVG